MTKSAANWLIALGSIATLLGLWVLRFAYQMFRTKEALIAYGLLAVGLAFLAVGVAKYKGKLVGAAIFVGVGGLAALAWPLAMSSNAAMMEGFQREIDLGKVAAAVCLGGGDASPAAPLAATGPRPLLWVSISEDRKSGYGAPWKDLPAPATPSELQIVACRTSTRTFHHSCNYEKAGRSVTISVYRNSDSFEIREARSGQILGTKTFDGDVPTGACDGSIVITKDTRSRDSATSPDVDAETAYLRTFVNP